ncbi:hypothetical protein N7456_013591 [Penicillium angulare]|uniref:Uncharacterized protein n=1 Tax=Penicillium angulare TaxID=116970 RepID=A0A9W9JT32_9EURO|nr:hypothetical protein N7456_013591 [Penicillium angulare]
MLGSNRALDAATQALVAVYPHFRGSDVAPNALQSYGNSLRVLRETLSEPGQVRSPYTLCAIYLMTICQSWLGSCDDDSETGHGEALAYLLKNLDLNMCQGWFEKEMITTLTVVVIMEGIANPRVYIDPAFMKKLIAFIQPQSLNSTTTLSIMSKLPKYLRDPVPHMAEISAAYYQLRHDINRIRSYLDQLPCTDSEPFSSPAVFHKSQIQAAHSVTLSLLTLLNALIRAYNPDNPALRVDTMVYCEQILHEAKAASCYRPLGAGYVALCLVVALAATDDPEQIERIETIMADYQKDFINTGWKKRAVLLKRTFEYHKIRGKSGGLTDDQFPKSEILCCMM